MLKFSENKHGAICCGSHDLQVILMWCSGQCSCEVHSISDKPMFVRDWRTSCSFIVDAQSVVELKDFGLLVTLLLMPCMTQECLAIAFMMHKQLRRQMTCGKIACCCEGHHMLSNERVHAQLLLSCDICCVQLLSFSESQCLNTDAILMIWMKNALWTGKHIAIDSMKAIIKMVRVRVEHFFLQLNLKLLSCQKIETTANLLRLQSHFELLCSHFDTNIQQETQFDNLMC